MPCQRCFALFMMPVAPSPRAARLAAGLLLLAALLAALGASVGSTGLDSLLHARHDQVAWQIVLDIRLPRTLGAWLAGALLGLAGAVAQGLFRNPLADPFLLGSAAGATLAVAAALAWGLGLAGLPLAAASGLARLGLTGAAFAGALGGVLLALALARGAQHTLRLLLAGVVVSYVLGAGKDLLTLAAPEILQTIQVFALGSSALVGWSGCALMAAALALCLLATAALARTLDALALGEATAFSLGLPLPALRAALVTVLALTTGAAVAQTGLIAFVGLAAPHLVRALAPVRHARLLPLSALMGGALLLAADIGARWLIAPQELPVGVLTAVLGGGYLLWLMQRQRAGGL